MLRTVGLGKLLIGQLGGCIDVGGGTGRGGRREGETRSLSVDAGGGGKDQLGSSCSSSGGDLMQW